jgi:hypothetical protein
VTGLPSVSQDPIQAGDPTRLAALLGQAGQTSLWGPDDLGAILAHQLRAPLLFDLQRVSAGGDGTAAGPAPDPWAEAAARQIRSFGDLLAHPAPPRALLVMTKAFAKTADAGGGGGAPPVLPPEVASVLYFAAIAAALVHLGERISALDDRAMAAGMTWVLGRTWLAAELRPLLIQVQTLLSLGRDPSETGR